MSPAFLASAVADGFPNRQVLDTTAKARRAIASGTLPRRARPGRSFWCRRQAGSAPVCPPVRGQWPRAGRGRIALWQCRQARGFRKRGRPRTTARARVDAHSKPAGTICYATKRLLKMNDAQSDSARAYFRKEGGGQSRSKVGQSMNAVETSIFNRRGRRGRGGMQKDFLDSLYVVSSCRVVFREPGI